MGKISCSILAIGVHRFKLYYINNETRFLTNGFKSMKLAYVLNAECNKCTAATYVHIKEVLVVNLINGMTSAAKRALIGLVKE